LDRLRADGLITQAAYAAAVRFRADCEHVAAVSGSHLDRLGEHVTCEAGDVDGQMLGRLAAMRRFRAARYRLGADRYALVYWVTVEDLSWQQLDTSKYAPATRVLLTT
jgi:hypothetical protein